MILLTNAIKYAYDVVEGKEITTKEVKRQCEIFIEDYEINRFQDEFKYYFDEVELKKVNNLLKLMNFATGIGIVNVPILKGLANFQCFFLCNIFGWRLKENHKRFRYKDVTLFIPRKNAKTFTIAVILLLLALTESDYSEFYSICLDRGLAAETKKAMIQIIEASPYIGKYFKTTTTLSGKITCTLTKSFYQARTAEANRNNAIKPSAILADEIGAFKDNANIAAMKSGQLSVVNPLLFKATTAYAESDSIMIEELDYIKKVFSGVIDDDRMFALVYYAEKEHAWDDIGLEMANPLRIKDNYDEIRDNRKKALEKPQERTEFLTKHMNIFVNSEEKEPYIIQEDWLKCSVDKVDFNNKEVVVGVDMSITTDLTAVSIMYMEDNKYYCKSHGFLPQESLLNRREKIDYYQMQRDGYCTIQKGKNINYTEVEQYIRDIETTYNCRIKAIVTDPYNAPEMIERLGIDYAVVRIVQSYKNLTVPTKEFRNEVYNGNVIYQKNKLLDWNVSNATLSKGKSEDVMLEKVNKNKQRIDMLVVLVFCFKELFENKNQVDLNNMILSDNFSC